MFLRTVYNDDYKSYNEKILLKEKQMYFFGEMTIHIDYSKRIKWSFNKY